MTSICPLRPSSFDLAQDRSRKLAQEAQGRLLPEPRWYAIQCAPCQEAAAATRLRQAGYHVTYPIDRCQIRKQHPIGQTTVRWIDKPHFPGYLFLALRYAGEPLAPVNGTAGVIRVVCRPISGEPLRIPSAVMDRLLAKRLVALDDTRGAIVMSETHLHGDRVLRVVLGQLGRWRCEVAA